MGAGNYYPLYEEMPFTGTQFSNSAGLVGLGQAVLRMSNGDHYTPYVQSVNGHYVDMAAGDDGENWAVKNDQWQPNANNTPRQSMANVAEGNTQHVIVGSNGATGSTYTDVVYRPYDCSTDAWGTEDVILSDVETVAGQAVHIAVRSDGDLLAVFQGLREKVHGTSYGRVFWARDEGAGFGNVTMIGGQAGNQSPYFHPKISMGGSDLAWINYAAGSTIPVYTISSTNTETLIDADGGITQSAGGNMFDWSTIGYYDDAGTSRVGFSVMDTISSAESHATYKDGTGAGSFTVEDFLLNEFIDSDAGNVLNWQHTASNKTFYETCVENSSPYVGIFIFSNEDNAGWQVNRMNHALAPYPMTRTGSVMTKDNGDVVLAFFWSGTTPYEYTEWLLGKRAVASKRQGYDPHRLQHGTLITSDRRAV